MKHSWVSGSITNEITLSSKLKWVGATFWTKATTTELLEEAVWGQHLRCFLLSFSSEEDQFPKCSISGLCKCRMGSSTWIWKVVAGLGRWAPRMLGELPAGDEAKEGDRWGRGLIDRRVGVEKVGLLTSHAGLQFRSSNLVVGRCSNSRWVLCDWLIWPKATRTKVKERRLESEKQVINWEVEKLRCEKSAHLNAEETQISWELEIYFDQFQNNRNQFLNQWECLATLR